MESLDHCLLYIIKQKQNKTEWPKRANLFFGIFTEMGDSPFRVNVLSQGNLAVRTRCNFCGIYAIRDIRPLIYFENRTHAIGVELCPKYE